MNKLEKSLLKLSLRERAIVESILEKLRHKDFTGLTIKKLKGVGSIYRVRKQQIRIIYTVGASDEIRLISISRKNEKTYKDF